MRFFKGLSCNAVQGPLKRNNVVGMQGLLNARGVKRVNKDKKDPEDIIIIAEFLICLSAALRVSANATCKLFLTYVDGQGFHLSFV